MDAIAINCVMELLLQRTSLIGCWLCCVLCAVCCVVVPFSLVVVVVVVVLLLLLLLLFVVVGLGFGIDLTQTNRIESHK